MYQLRRWYEQFYVDVADVTADMVDRFEHELDTSSPRAEWLKVVETNMAGQSVTADSLMTVRVDGRLSDLPAGVSGVPSLWK